MQETRLPWRVWGAMARWLALTAVLPMALLVLPAPGLATAAMDPPPEAAAALRQRFAGLRSRPEPNPSFDVPLFLQADDAPGRLRGDVHALVDRPYQEVRRALGRVDHWCRILILHLNVKYCRPSDGPNRNVLVVGIGRKYDQPLESMHWLNFKFDVGYAGDEYLSVVLHATDGPFDTYDYQLGVEATALDGRSLLHVTYAYSYGALAQLAMHAYLATLGWDKVGFSVVGRQADGRPLYVGGLQGVIERNAMRYYLAIDAYLGAQRLPVPERLDASLRNWFDATERYRRQLREVDRRAYLEMKQREVERQEEAAAQ